VHLQEVVTGASRRQLEKVQADAAPSAYWPGDWKGEEQAGGRQVVRLHALARGAGLDELLYCCGEACVATRRSGGPRQGSYRCEDLIAAEVATERSRVELQQHLHAELANRWYAQAVAARALAVEQPVTRDEEAGLNGLQPLP
jgi:hypothetical protein